MSRVNVAEIKARLSEYLDRAAQGESIVICRHNKPVAELRALEPRRNQTRPIGPLTGRPTFELNPAFFDPLTDDELEAWEGSSAWPAHVPDTTAKVAEGASTPATRKSRRRNPS